jgi:hypothetical protein
VVLGHGAFWQLVLTAGNALESAIGDEARQVLAVDADPSGVTRGDEPPATARETEEAIGGGPRHV